MMPINFENGKLKISLKFQQAKRSLACKILFLHLKLTSKQTTCNNNEAIACGMFATRENQFIQQ